MSLTMILRHTAAVALLAALAPASAMAQNATGDALLARLQTRYRSLSGLRAQFTQTMQAEGAAAQTFSGTLTAQGNRYRVEAGPQVFVTDGRTTWMYDRRRNQVVVNRYVANQTAFSPTTFFGSAGQRFRVTNVRSTGSGAAQVHTLTLAPRSQSEMFQTVTLTMRNADNTVSRVEMQDANGTAMTYELRNLQLNPRIPASTFTFASPRGAEVVDLR